MTARRALRAVIASAIRTGGEAAAVAGGIMVIAAPPMRSLGRAVASATFIPRQELATVMLLHAQSLQQFAQQALRRWKWKRSAAENNHPPKVIRLSEASYCTNSACPPLILATPEGRCPSCGSWTYTLLELIRLNWRPVKLLNWRYCPEFSCEAVFKGALRDSPPPCRACGNSETLPLMEWRLGSNERQWRKEVVDHVTVVSGARP